MTTAPPSITIGMPIYNGAAFIGRALDSLLAQDYRDFQVIISDNASTDGTDRIIEEKVGQDPRFTIIRQPATIPARDNFDFVLFAAKSDLFCFLAYDDWWTPNRLGVLVGLHRDNPGIELAVTRSCWVYPDGREEMRAAYEHCPGTGPGAIRQRLATAQAGWFYGLYRREAVARALRALADSRTDWAWDFLALLPFILRGTVAGSNDALFFQYLSGLTNQNFKPKTTADQRRVFSQFLNRSLVIVREEVPGAARRAILAPSMLLYASRRAWKLKRVIRSWLKDLILFRL